MKGFGLFLAVAFLIAVLPVALDRGGPPLILGALVLGGLVFSLRRRKVRR